MKVWNYLDQMVSDDRISEGQKALAQNADLLRRIEARYGVDKEVIVAIWGMESHYGAVLTRPGLVKSTIRSLATLAYSGGRLASFGRKQLVAALKIVQRGDVTPEGMTGSWAGAMGHTQFIPTTFEAYGVDFDGDGHRNIWTSPVDALASTANYLNKSGWHHGETWGYEVVVPAGVKATSERSLGAWAKLGVVRVGGKGFPRPGDKATLYRPNGSDGPSFLLLHNFSVIKRYNNSNFYALAVGHLSDRLAGFGPFVQAVAGARDAAVAGRTRADPVAAHHARPLRRRHRRGARQRQPRGDPQLPALGRADAGRGGDAVAVAAAGRGGLTSRHGGGDVIGIPAESPDRTAFEPWPAALLFCCLPSRSRFSSTLPADPGLAQLFPRAPVGQPNVQNAPPPRGGFFQFLFGPRQNQPPPPPPAARQGQSAPGGPPPVATAEVRAEGHQRQADPGGRGFRRRRGRLGP